MVIPALLSVVFLFIPPGCSQKTPPQSHFVQSPERLSVNERFPFELSWFQEGEHWKNYNKIKISPIYTEHLVDLNYLHSPEAFERSADDRQADVQAIADYMHQSIVTAFQKDKKSPLKVVDFVDQNTLILELAIMELTPFKFGQMAYVADSSLQASREEYLQGTIVMEGQVRDGKSGIVLGAFMDRHQTRFRLLRSPSKMTRYGFAKTHINDWANQFVALSKLPHQKD
jgi:hypothetical protein